jgi:hypothetical protein
VIVVDFPDPTNFSIGKLYTTSFYQLVDEHLNAGGYAVVQTTSPLSRARASGPWPRRSKRWGSPPRPTTRMCRASANGGFILASRRPHRMPLSLPAGPALPDVAGCPPCSQFPPDMARVAAEPNRLSNQVLVQTFEQEWGKVHCGCHRSRACRAAPRRAAPLAAACGAASRRAADGSARSMSAAIACATEERQLARARRAAPRRRAGRSAPASPAWPVRAS